MGALTALTCNGRPPVNAQKWCCRSRRNPPPAITAGRPSFRPSATSRCASMQRRLASASMQLHRQRGSRSRCSTETGARLPWRFRDKLGGAGSLNERPVGEQHARDLEGLTANRRVRSRPAPPTCRPAHPVRRPRQPPLRMEPRWRARLERPGSSCLTRPSSAARLRRGPPGRRLPAAPRDPTLERHAANRRTTIPAAPSRTLNCGRRLTPSRLRRFSSGAVGASAQRERGGMRRVSSPGRATRAPPSFGPDPNEPRPVAARRAPRWRSRSRTPSRSQVAARRPWPAPAPAPRSCFGRALPVRARAPVSASASPGRLIAGGGGDP